MQYIEVRITPGDRAMDCLVAFLLDHGIDSISMEDPRAVEEILEKKHEYDWDYVSEELLSHGQAAASATFYLDPEQEELLGKIQREAVARRWSLEHTLVDDEMWKNKYREHFNSLKLTEHIVVKPSWEEKDGVAGEDYLELDPGMAFGTGDHATTAMCAALMEKTGCSRKTVLDVGTGSGILAIAAAMLGSTTVYGVDVDPAAVEIARENVARNHCADRVHITEEDVTKGLSVRADVIVANLMAELILLLTPHVRNHLEKGGTYIASGILREKMEKVMEAMEKEGFRIAEIVNKGEWSAIAVKYE